MRTLTAYAGIRGRDGQCDPPADATPTFILAVLVDGVLPYPAAFQGATAIKTIQQFALFCPAVHWEA